MLLNDLGSRYMQMYGLHACLCVLNATKRGRKETKQVEGCGRSVRVCQQTQYHTNMRITSGDKRYEEQQLDTYMLSNSVGDPRDHHTLRSTTAYNKAVPTHGVH